MNLIQADSIPTGSEIWVEDEADGGEEVWMLATVVEQKNTLLTVRKKKTGEDLEIDLVSSWAGQPPGVELCEVTTGHDYDDEAVLSLHFLRKCSNIDILAS